MLVACEGGAGRADGERARADARARAAGLPAHRVEEGPVVLDGQVGEARRIHGRVRGIA